MLRRKPTPAPANCAAAGFLAPNDYIITLSVPDYQKVSADPDLTSTTFARHLEGYIHEQGWQTYGDVVVRFEQSANLHTGQFRARGAVNPDSTTGEPAPAHRDRASNAEPGVPPMTDNPSYRGGQGQGRPADEYYDDRYGPPEDRTGGQDPRAVRGHPAGAAGLPAAGRAGYRPASGLPRARAATRTRVAIPRPGGYPPQQYEQRPPAGYGPRKAAATRPGLPSGTRRLRPAARRRPASARRRLRLRPSPAARAVPG